MINMKIEEMKQLKREWGYTNEEISERTGVAVGTVQKIFSGETKSPRRETIKALEKLFCGDSHAVYPGPVYDFPPEGKPVLVKEGNLAEEAYAALPQGKYTAEDYNNWPDDKRIELIDGRIYNLATPTLAHEFIIGEILTDFKNFVRRNSGSCIPFGSNVSVYIDRDLNTVLQPDLTVVCDRSKLHPDGNRIWGGPDLVVEVLSPSTRRKDMTLKLNKYCDGGVREYWIIDPAKEQVIIYDFAHNDLVSVYSFEDKIPVGIWESKCEVDFSQIKSRLSDIFG